MPHLRKQPGRAIMKSVELRGLEPLTPLTASEACITASPQVNDSEQRIPRSNTAVGCSCQRLDAVRHAPVLQFCSRHTSVNTRPGFRHTHDKVCSNLSKILTYLDWNLW